ncbi:putative bifunctional diguanylate cyclase/phosphodiesterase [Thiorhodovibrio frisius]|uniref:cyclic-guanylate-specific phosphodiesterase n=1 Tax=Thiorhodovibrio frisius TaxID=631362 RepID=H8YWW0_9GAMM|nr:EAL domain-containing protein [Thiorhodovibrio frisius]EIC22936.1 PAS domain S-box/diguanylate cyclase (GGDEF) domain-containing protein [Thiorhodovibrio frisius]WPL22805.1 Bacteriophytochrome cph2 [Thiorhodovibrio frisius]
MQAEANPTANLEALEYYRSQCDELGARVMRLQDDLTLARQDAQRNRTLAFVIQQMHEFAQHLGDKSADADRLGEQLLMLLVERLRIDVAALLRLQDETHRYQIKLGVGIRPGILLPVMDVPRATGSRLLTDDPVLQQTGLDTALWAESPPSPWILLLGTRRKTAARRQGLDQADGVIAEAAIKIYDGLLGRQAALLALRDSEANYRSLFEGAQDPILVMDLRAEKILDANHRGIDLFGCSFDQLPRQAPLTWLIPADPQHWKPVWKQALKGQAQRIETQIRTSRGHNIWTEINIKRINARAPVLLVVVRDISARRQAEEELSRLQERLDLALEGAEVGLYDVNLTTGEIVYDDRYVRILGGDRQRIPKTVDEWRQGIHPEDIPTVQRFADEVLAGNRDKVELEYRFRHQSGQWIWLLDRGKGFDFDPSGQPRRAAGTCVDITERKRSEASIHRLAYYDPLTDLPNRRLFLDRLVNAQATAQRSGHIGAVLFLDLDRFKQVNDARGHEFGDHLLLDVTSRLHELLRAEDTIARLGGDEFVILLAQLTQTTEEASRFAHLVAEKIRQALAAPYRLMDTDISSSVSIGITLFRGNEVTVHDILREADTALYRAKEHGRNCVRFFEVSMQQAAEVRFSLEGELRQATKDNGLQLYYQPQFDAEEHLIGYEALLRWPHPTKGMISPVVFIPIAEETGLILPIGQWVLTEACRFLAHIRRCGHDLRMSVNVSPRQFQQPNFVDLVQQALTDFSLPPQQLILEITEGVVIDDIQGTVTRMQELKSLGVQLSLDDFGTGYSSLAYLKRLPVDELKIDRSFIQDVCTDSNDAALVEAILAVCRHLDVTVVAEGVETLEQLQFLHARGCDSYQGFYFGMPVPSKTVVENLAIQDAPILHQENTLA